MNRCRYRFLPDACNPMTGIGNMLKQYREIVYGHHLCCYVPLSRSFERLGKSRMPFSVPGVIALLILFVISIGYSRFDMYFCSSLPVGTLHSVRKICLYNLKSHAWITELI